jgi:hypothetical protein
MAAPISLRVATVMELEWSATTTLFPRRLTMNRIGFAIAVVIGFAALSIAQTRPGSPLEPVLADEPVEQHAQWEFMEIHSQTPNIREFNKLGKEGWDLSECHQANGTTYYIFIRPVYDVPVEGPAAKEPAARGPATKETAPPAKGSSIKKYFK